MRRATDAVIHSKGTLEISIRALREEGDSACLLSQAPNQISIRALREEGDAHTIVMTAAMEISIRALREEGDSFVADVVTGYQKFQSAPSVRRATYDPLNAGKDILISIRALREEGDSSSSLGNGCWWDFNPRPP